ncbi:MAG TPA: TIGR02996 domain-containing protein [Gemmataceae bacterium]|nr:TIGR02996 domain-containing protein [Gemmataceae bacterium]
MTHEEAFIQAIRETPADDAPRLIFADWLEEHGQADRAEFIRVQCRLARLSDEEPDQPILLPRAEGLLRKHWNEWVGPLRAIVGPWRDRYGERWMGEEYHPDGLRRFQRGFVDVLALDAEDFLRHAEHLKRLVPLRELRLWRAGRCADHLAKEPELAGLSVLSFTDYYDAPLTAAEAVALALSPYLYGLSALYLGRNSLGDKGVEALARAPWLEHVTVLDLSDNGLSDRALHALAESPYVVNLRKIFLQNNYFSWAGIDALRTSPNLRSITHLEYRVDIQLGLVSTRNVFLLGGSGRS